MFLWITAHKWLSLSILILLALILIVLIFAAYVSVRIGSAPAPRPEWAKLAYYKNGMFQNQEPTLFKLKKTLTKMNFLRFLFEQGNAPETPFPMEHPGKDCFVKKPEGAPRVTWLGHSMLIFEFGGARFLTDPVFGNAAPLPGLVRRYQEAPLKREDLPDLDFILISHDHYDHLEYETIRFFADSSVPFLVPAGVGERLKEWGIAPERIHELLWGESLTLSGVTVTAETARHFSGRWTADRNRTLWASFVFQAHGKKVFFGADGGYGAHFRELGAKYSGFDLALLEIDAWNERWPRNHMFPKESLQAAQDLRARKIMPIHWGVFDLAMHPWKESIGLFTAEADARGVPYLTPKMGETLSWETPYVNRFWWDSDAGKP